MGGESEGRRRQTGVREKCWWMGWWHTDPLMLQLHCQWLCMAWWNTHTHARTHLHWYMRVHTHINKPLWLHLQRVFGQRFYASTSCTLLRCWICCSWIKHRNAHWHTFANHCLLLKVIKRSEQCRKHNFCPHWVSKSVKCIFGLTPN